MTYTKKENEKFHKMAILHVELSLDNIRKQKLEQQNSLNALCINVSNDTHYLLLRKRERRALEVLQWLKDLKL